ncbi:hypothetical protein GQ457_15G022820 [Hibiscus cannabinus]
MTRVHREEDKPDAIYETNSSKFTTVVHHGGSFYRTTELIYTANDNDVLEMVSKLPRNHYVHVYLEEVLTACSDANVEPDCNVEVSDVGSFEPEINVEVSDVAGNLNLTLMLKIMMLLLVLNLTLMLKIMMLLLVLNLTVMLKLVMLI